MKSQTALAKNIHILIILYALWEAYAVYEEKIITYENSQNQVAAIKTEIQNKKKILTEIDIFKNNLEESKKRIEDVSSQIEKVQRQLPATIVDTEVIKYFSEEMTQINIKNLKVTPLVEKAEEFYFTKGFETSANGTFLQIIIFMEKLLNADRLFNVKRLVMTQPKVKTKGRYQLVDFVAEIETFRYKIDNSSGVVK